MISLRHSKYLSATITKKHIYSFSSSSEILKKIVLYYLKLKVNGEVFLKMSTQNNDGQCR